MGKNINMEKSKSEIFEFSPDICGIKTLEESLNKIVDLNEIKQKIKDIREYIIFAQKACNEGLKIPTYGMHMVFTGNSGTGKTTIAKIIAKTLFDVGMLQDDKLIEVEGKDLVNEHTKHTATKTSEIIQRAMGGVLFINEAYSLSPSDSKKDFSQEAITALIKAMEDYKDQLVIIFAGDKKEMQHFINNNPDIASRIEYTFNFKDYTVDQLYRIFTMKMKEAGFVVDEKAKEKTKELIGFFLKIKDIENGRLVDKIIQESLLCHSKNCANNPEHNISEIKEIDIPTIEEILKDIYANNEFTNPENIDPEDLKKTAYHEAGHAFTSATLYDKTNINLIKINAEGTGILGYDSFKKERKYTQNKEELIKEITVVLSGLISEETCLGSFGNRCTADLREATSLCKNMVTKYGMSSLGLVTIDNPSSDMEMIVFQEINQILRECLVETRRIIFDNKETVVDIANHIIKHKELSEETLRDIIKKHASKANKTNKKNKKQEEEIGWGELIFF